MEPRRDEIRYYYIPKVGNEAEPLPMIVGMEIAVSDIYVLLIVMSLIIHLLRVLRTK